MSEIKISVYIQEIKDLDTVALAVEVLHTDGKWAETVERTIKSNGGIDITIKLPEPEVKVE